jgi:hypothetical protein
VNLLKDPLEVLARLDYRPKRAEVPSSVFPLEATLGDLYGYALDLQEPVAADWHLRWLVVHNLHQREVRTEEGVRGMTLCEAFREERLGLWFYALARDVARGGYRVIEAHAGLTGNCAGIPYARFRREEFTHWRRHACQLYGCVAPFAQAGAPVSASLAAPAKTPPAKARRAAALQPHLFDEFSLPQSI